jgi:hypothetical protein
VFPTRLLEGRDVFPGEGAKYLAKNDEITCGICTRSRELQERKFYASKAK